MRLIAASVALWVVVLALGAAPGHGAPGDLDPSFDGDGVQTTDFGNGSVEATDVAGQPDGKIVAVGGGSGDFALARYNPDGSLDTGFSDDGIQTTSFGGFSDAAGAVAIQPDGRIVVAGRAGGGSLVFALARYDPDGSLDTSFSDDGRQTTSYPSFGPSAASDLAIQSDGRIVAVGQAADEIHGSVFVLARYLPDGSLDTSFSGDGLQTTAVGSEAAARAVALQPDGRIVVAGEGELGRLAVARYRPDGSLDTSFSDDGVRTTAFPGAGGSGEAVIVQPDGRIVAGGASNVPGASEQFALARYNADGSLDSSFSDDGLQTTDVGGPGSVHALALQSDGKLVAVGTNGDDLVVARYDPAGSLDPSFSGDGLQTTDFGGFDGASGLFLQADGRIVSAGSTHRIPGTEEFALARYGPDGSLDPSFSGDGRQTTGFPGGVDSAEDVALQPDGRIVAAGRDGSGGFALARYLPDGSLDSTFSGDGRLTSGPARYGSGARAAAIGPDGGIVAVGQTDWLFGIARYHPDGSPDTRFSGNGLRIAWPGFEGAFEAVALQPDGKIVAAGSHGLFVVARFNPDGSPDPGFSDDGRQATNFPGNSSDEGKAVVVQPDGRIVVAGDGGDRSRGSNQALARYNADGSLDTSFSGDGLQLTNGVGAAHDLALQPDGKLVAAGRWIARYNPDGSPDASFSGDGLRPTGFPASGFANAVVLQPDGKIVVAGRAGQDLALARYHPDGSPDSGFSGDGVLTHPVAPAEDATLAPDGTIVTAGGDAEGDFAIARLEGGPLATPPPEPDPTTIPGEPQSTARAPAASAPRAAPRRVTASTTPRGDRTRPYTFTTTGRVVTPPYCAAGVTPTPAGGRCVYRTTASCTGVVRVRFRRLASTISSRSVRLRRDCTYRSQVAFRTRDPRRRGTLRVLVAFRGNPLLTPRSAPVHSVRAGGRRR